MENINITVESLFARIGRMSIEIEALRERNILLANQLAKYKEAEEASKAEVPGQVANA